MDHGAIEERKEGKNITRLSRLLIVNCADIDCYQSRITTESLLKEAKAELNYAEEFNTHLHVYNDYKQITTNFSLSNSINMYSTL